MRTIEHVNNIILVISYHLTTNPKMNNNLNIYIYIGNEYPMNYSYNVCFPKTNFRNELILDHLDE